MFSASPLSYMLREGPRLRFDFVMKVWPKGWGDFLCGQYFRRVENAVLTSCRWLTDPCLGLVRPELAGNCPRPGVSLFFSFKTGIRPVVQKCAYIHSPSVCELDILSQLLACFFIPCSVALLGGWVGHRSLCFHKIG